MDQLGRKRRPASRTARIGGVVAVAPVFVAPVFVAPVFVAPVFVTPVFVAAVVGAFVRVRRVVIGRVKACALSVPIPR